MDRNTVIQNLQDAGLSEAQTAEFLRYFDQGSKEEQIRLLRRCRPMLMEELHASQKKVDCLDFLVCRLEKEKRKCER